VTSNEFQYYFPQSTRAKFETQKQKYKDAKFLVSLINTSISISFWYLQQLRCTIYRFSKAQATNYHLQFDQSTSSTILVIIEFLKIH